MNQSQKQARTCGNCQFSKDATPTSMNNDPDPEQVTCKKNLTPDANDKNMAGVYIYADTPADKCPGWEAKDEQKQ